MGGKPSKPVPGKTLQVIAAGYSRTGTVAIQLALETLLSGPVLHGGTSILGREDAHCRLWVEAYRAKRAGDFDRTCDLIRQLTDGFVGVADMPPIDFIPELMAVYPDARVVLTTRDPDSWLKSVGPVAANASLWWLPYPMVLVPGWRWFPTLSREFGTSAKIILGWKEDHKAPANPAPGKELLLKWNEHVKSLVPPEKLLVMELKEGWKPLCNFLDVPVPDEPIPRANDSAAVAKVAEDITAQLVKIWVGIVSVVTISGFAAFRLWENR
ncbi:hypothetical protein MAPG_06247 [Magnaporthiopsis poae ATCC 64411]|uniref:NAD dependent epimerase/dehydratase n=1 Tax=Magnaporthiopsis poae (strain ATCC 64411 / 73-15) TaxID=644358 RepID=A0A0C4E1I6_MAGP6|nr:hypothetical protein MAPG_06247 [Magnaporthiopsis poae ATCC 64411]